MTTSYINVRFNFDNGGFVIRVDGGDENVRREGKFSGELTDKEVRKFEVQLAEILANTITGYIREHIGIEE